VSCRVVLCCVVLCCVGDVDIGNLTLTGVPFCHSFLELVISGLSYLFVRRELVLCCICVCVWCSSVVSFDYAVLHRCTELQLKVCPNFYAWRIVMK
jgi:hypothetical protein